MTNYYAYPYILLTGGGDGALDSLDGSLIKDGDWAVVTTNTGVFVYRCNATSAAAESSPAVISPDSNAGDKRWILMSFGGVFGTTATSGAISFVQAGTGAVSRTMLAKSKEIFSVTDFGAVGDGPSNTNDQAAIQAAIDAAEAANCGFVYFPKSVAGYRIDSGLTIEKSGVVLVGDGPKSAILCPTFNTDAIVTFGGTASLVEDTGMRGMGIVHIGTRNAGNTFAFGRNLARCCLENVSVSAAFNLLAYGSAAYPLETSDCTLRNFHGQGTGDGIICTNQASLFLEHCRINGTAGNNTRGIKLPYAFDGLWLDSETTIETHDNSFEIVHAAGSVANIFLNGCAFDRPLVAALRINISGTAVINGVYVNGLKIYDTVGSGDTDGILVENSGSGGIDGIELRNVSARDLRQRFANFNAVVTNLLIQGCQSLRGGLKNANTYAGIELNSLAHDHVNITNNRIGSQHKYGISNALNSTNIIITGNDFVDGDSASTNNMGSTSSTRIITNNI